MSHPNEFQQTNGYNSYINEANTNQYLQDVYARHDQESTASYYDDATDTTSPKWNILSSSSDDPETEDTVELNMSSVLTEVTRSTNVEEAIDSYLERFPHNDWVEGKVRAEEAAAMLVKIKDVYSSTMTPTQREFITTEAVGAVHEIATLTREAEADPQTGEIPTPPTLYRIVDVLDMVEEEVQDPEVINAVEDDLKTVLEAIEKNPEKKDFVQPIETALEWYDKPDNDDPLGMIVTNVLNRQLSIASNNFEEKVGANPEKYPGLYAGEIEKKSTAGDGNESVDPTYDNLDATGRLTMQELADEYRDVA